MQIGVNTFHLGQTFGLNDKCQLDEDGFTKSVLFLKETGVHLIELLLDTMPLRPSLFGVRTETTLLYLKEKEGISYSAHLPFRYVDISSINEEVRKLSVKCMQESVRFCERLDIRAYVLHLTGSVAGAMVSSRYLSKQRIKDALLNEMMSNAAKSLSEILETVPADKICIENLPNMPFKYYYQVVEKLNTSICFDVGHLISGGEDPLRFFDRYYERIKEIHLHDVTRTKDENGCVHLLDHQTLGTGILDVEQFVSYLEQREFRGYLILEFMNEKKALKSWKTLVDKNLRCTQYQLAKNTQTRPDNQHEG